MIPGDEFIQMNRFQHFYFAYGSCMDIEGRITRHGRRTDFQILGVGRLDGYRFVLNKRSRENVDGATALPRICVKANIEACGSASTYGVLYMVTDQGLEYLDEREGANSGQYQRRIVAVEQGGRIVENVITYMAGPDFVASMPLPVPQIYASELLRGALGLPPQYLKRSFLPEVLGRDWFDASGRLTHCAEAFHTGLPFSLPPAY